MRGPTPPPPHPHKPINARHDTPPTQHPPSLAGDDREALEKANVKYSEEELAARQAAIDKGQRVVDFLNSRRMVSVCGGGVGVCVCGGGGGGRRAGACAG